MRVYFTFVLWSLMIFLSSCSSVDDSKTLKEIANETEIHIPKCASIDTSTLSLLKQKKEINTGVVSNDKESPKMTFNGANPLVLQQGETYNRECAIAVDAQDGQVDVYIQDDTVNTSKAGEYTILFSATDSVGNIAELRRIVRVLPTIPTITLNGDQNITLKQNQTYQEFGATAKDNLDKTIEVKISGKVDTNTIGSYTLTYTATDKNQNSASITRTVNIIDGIAPVITLNGDQNITLKQNQTYQEFGATAKDNLDKTIEVKISGKVDTNTIGSYTLTYTATDKNQNSASVIRTVNVIAKPNSSLPLTIHTPYEGFTVVLHGTTKQLNLIATKTTNKDGNVTFIDSDYNLSFAENNISFSIVIDSNDQISPQEIFDIELLQIIKQAYNKCAYIDSNITECSTADWCSLSLKNEIPVWLFNAAQAYLWFGNNSEITKEIDQNTDNTISPQELYDAKITYGWDKNKDGVLARNEINLNKNISIITFINLPAQSYSFTMDQIKKQDNYNSNNYCQQTTTLALANTSDVNYFSVFGSASGYEKNLNKINEINTTLYPLYTDQYGNFNYFVIIYNIDNQLMYIKPLLNIPPRTHHLTIDIDQLDTPLLTDVEISQDSNDTTLELALTHNGVTFDTTQTSRFIYADPSLYYLLKSNRYFYDYTTGFDFTFMHHDYYGDGNLSELYTASDYPMLDVSVSLDKNGTIEFSGNEKDKLQLTVMNIGYFDKYDKQDTYISIYRFNDTSPISPLENINIFPPKIKTILINLLTHPEDIDYVVSAFEFKDFSVLHTVEQLTLINHLSSSDYSNYDNDQSIFLKYRFIRVDFN